MAARRVESELHVLRISWMIFILLGCAMLWVSLLTHNPFDWPSTLQFPPNEPPANGCGRLGAWISFQLVHFFGIGAYVLAVAATGAGLMKLWQGRVSDWPHRLLGSITVMTSVSTMGTLLLGGVSEGRLTDGGGVVGIAIANYLGQNKSLLGVWGTSLVIMAALTVGLMLSAREIVIRVPRVMRWAGWTAKLAWSSAHAAAVMSQPRAKSNDEPQPYPGVSWLQAHTRDWLKRSAEFVDGLQARFGATAEAPAAKPTKRELAGAGTNYDPNETAAKPAKRPRNKATTVEESTASDGAVTTEVAEAPAEAITETAAVATVDEVTADAADTAADIATEKPTEEENKRPGLIVRNLGVNRPKAPAPSPWPKDYGDYALPAIELLGEPEYHYQASQEAVVRDLAAVLEQTLQDFRVDASVVGIDTGPVITMYEIALAPGIKVSQIASLSNDIARALKAPAVRVVAPLPGKNTVGIEVPNINKEKVRLRELITLGGVKSTKHHLPLFLGKDASGDPLIADIAAMPHMLIAGTTGSGKSVCINTLIMSVLMTQRPDHVKMILVDPKMVEMSMFKDVPHLMCPIVTDMQRAEMILEWAATKMDERYELLAEAGVRHIAAFNRLGKEEIYKRFEPSNEAEKAAIPTHLPYIVIIIDELADLMMTSGKQVELHLCRIAQKSRAVGIHIILATQRPQANVVTGLIKSNLPSRVAFRVASRMDSRIVLDQNGAEVLMGQGDMLFLPPGSSKLVRAQGTYIEDDELKAVLDDLRSKAQPEFHHELVRLKPTDTEGSSERDPLFDKAATIVCESQRGSVSLLQRRLEVGYTRASRLVEQMYEAGIVGEYKGSQSREVLISAKEWQQIMKQRDGEVASGGYAADDEADTKYAVEDTGPAVAFADPIADDAASLDDDGDDSDVQAGSNSVAATSAVDEVEFDADDEVVIAEDDIDDDAPIESDEDAMDEESALDDGINDDAPYGRKWDEDDEDEE